MPVSKVMTVVPDKGSEQAKAEALAIIPTLRQEVTELQINGADDYLYADELLGRITGAQRVWFHVWDRIMEKTVKPIRQGLEGLYEMNREIDKPLETMAADVKARMRAYKQKELQDKLLAERAREEEQRRLEAEAQAKIDAAARASTPQMKGRLSAAAQKLMQQAQTVAVEETPEPVRGVNSSERRVEKPAVVSIQEFCRGVADGVIPTNMVIVPIGDLNRAWKDNPDVVKEWPGVEIVVDVQLVRR